MLPLTAQCVPPAPLTIHYLTAKQVPQGMREDTLLDLFRKCGDIAGAHI